MKKQFAFLFFLMFTVPVIAQKKTDHKETAKTILTLLNNNEYSKAVSYFDTSYAKRLTPERLEKTWTSVIKLVGAYKKTTDITVNSQPGTAIVLQKCEFEKRSMNLRMSFNSKEKIINFSILPDSPKDKYELPAYYDSTKVEELEVKITNGTFKLPGTLTMPKTGSKFPVVVFVHGSGSNDRDESVGASKVFKDMALGLAMKGVASLRYEKRTKVYGGRLMQNKKINTVKEETIDDVIAAVHSLGNYSSIDTNRVFLIGHGLGGMLLPRIAQQLPGLSGLFIMGASGGRLEDVFYNESVYLLALDSMTSKKEAYLDTLKRQAAKVKLITPASANDTTVDNRLLGFPKTYWIDLSTYNQLKTAKKLGLPVYILQAERDYQVSMNDFELWKKELSQNRNVHFKSYPKLNHLFIEGQGKGSPAEYDKRGNVASYVLDDLKNWIDAAKDK